MKIQIAKFISNISHQQFRNIVLLIMNNIGMIKRDMLQNKSEKIKDKIHTSTWSCTDFLLKKICRPHNIYVHDLHSFELLLNPLHKPQLIYDLESCSQSHKTIIGAFFLQDENDLYLLIIDIINVAMMLVCKNNVYHLSIGSKIQAYKNNTKVYSLLYNAILFNKIDQYISYDSSKQLNTMFYSLYSKTAIY